MGSSQYRSDGGRVPSGIHPAFLQKRNVIPKEVEKPIIMFFKGGLKDSTLIRKLEMKNPRTLEEMLAITNKYALAEEATLETRESKKDQKLSYPDRPGTSKSNNKKRKYDHSVAIVERPRRNRTEYWPRPDEYNGFLDGILKLHICPHVGFGRVMTKNYKSNI
jgi:hypothetical protein